MTLDKIYEKIEDGSMTVDEINKMGLTHFKGEDTTHIESRSAYFIEFDTIVPEFPKDIEIIQKVSETSFLVKSDKLPQEWVLVAKITKM